MGHTGERQQMVLADPPQWNCPGQHQLVVTLVAGEGGGREGPGGEQLGIGSGHTAWGVGHSLDGRIEPEGLKQGPGGTGRRRHIGRSGVPHHLQGRNIGRRVGAVGDDGMSGAHRGTSP